ncbi:MAG: hypothetical protein MI750_14760 [Xanthomonadales bacterium]|nr:hypothetical protein [Xanthomonadales bacterium]
MKTMHELNLDDLEDRIEFGLCGGGDNDDDDDGGSGSGGGGSSGGGNGECTNPNTRGCDPRGG